MVAYFCHHLSDRYVKLSDHHVVNWISHFEQGSIFTVFKLSIIWQIHKIIWKVDKINWQVDKIIWKVNIINWQVDIMIWQVDTVIRHLTNDDKNSYRRNRLVDTPCAWCDTCDPNVLRYQERARQVTMITCFYKWVLKEDVQEILNSFFSIKIIKKTG